MAFALEVRALWKSYLVGIPGCSARVSVLRGADLRIAPGERVGILGRPASGKTTLLHCIAGLRRPDAGRIRLHENEPAAVTLIDEEHPIGTLTATGAGATLIVARDLTTLRQRVDRIVVLHDGRLVPLSAPRIARRVAEARAGDDVGGRVERAQRGRVS